MAAGASVAPAGEMGAVPETRPVDRPKKGSPMLVAAIPMSVATSGSISGARSVLAPDLRGEPGPPSSRLFLARLRGPPVELGDGVLVLMWTWTQGFEASPGAEFLQVTQPTFWARLISLKVAKRASTIRQNQIQILRPSDVLLARPSRANSPRPTTMRRFPLGLPGCVVGVAGLPQPGHSEAVVGTGLPHSGQATGD